MLLLHQCDWKTERFLTSPSDQNIPTISSPMATTFYDKSSALPGQLMCIMPKVGKKNLSFFLLAINEILNEIAAANYDNFSLLSGKDMIAILLLFITFRQGYHCNFISPG
jgi:hypothetical protein